MPCKEEAMKSGSIHFFRFVPLFSKGGAVAACLFFSALLWGGGMVWDFEQGSQGWKPRASTIHLERVPVSNPVPGSHYGLKIAGRIAGGWNYALSDTRPMEGGKLYRLSAWLRVVRVGPETPMPYFKCEFVGADRAGFGRVNTEPYDPRRMGQWQQLTAEFQAPQGTRFCWVALEKGGKGTMEIEAYVDEVRIEPISRLSVYERFRLHPIPASLLQVQGVHPRLFLTRHRLAELRRAIRTTHAALWQEVQRLADQAVRSGPPKYRRNDGWSGEEQLWERGVGNTMPVLAMAYLLSGDQKYLKATRQWALASCHYPTWGLGRLDGMDLAAGHQLFGLAVVYDWCFDALDQATRTTIRRTLHRRANAMFEAAAQGKLWWTHAYLQNHMWVDCCGLAAAGFALFDEDPDALLWIGFAKNRFQRTMDSLGPDGASHEGVGYWEYGAEYMAKFLWLARDLLGIDFFDRPWWRHTARYALYLSLPRAAWTRKNCIVDLADCPRYHWYGPDHILRLLAREYRDGVAQWLAQQVDEAHVEAPSAPWLNLIWYDPTVPPIPPTRLPTLHHFSDLGIVSARSDWSGHESLVVFKCGPFIGHKAMHEFSRDPGGGHVHPDANHFVIFAEGEWLIRDDGYRPKWTGQHNTLLIDGVGQIGEGRMWFAGQKALAAQACPKILQVRSTAQMDWMVGDATSAYPRKLGLRRFVRQLLFVKPDVLIVADEVEVDRPRQLELRFHPESSKVRKEGHAWIVEGRRSVLRLDELTPDGVEARAEELPAYKAHGGQDTMFTIWFRAHRQHWRHIVAISWAKKGEQPPVVQLRKEGAGWKLQVHGRWIPFSWTTR